MVDFELLAAIARRGHADTAVIIPAFDTQESLDEIMETWKRLEGFSSGGSPDDSEAFDVIVVDDGSNPPLLRRERWPFFVELVRLEENSGTSAALVHGLKIAYSRGYSSVVFMDSDGQHDPEKVPEFVRALKTSRFVFGNRFEDPGSVPSGKIRSNGFATALMAEVLGKKQWDVACGFKGFALDRDIVRDLVEGVWGKRAWSHRFSLICQIVCEAVRRGETPEYVPIEARYPEQAASGLTNAEEVLSLLEVTKRYCPPARNMRRRLGKAVKAASAREDFTLKLREGAVELRCSANGTGYEIAGDWSMFCRALTGSPFCNKVKSVAIVPDGGRRWAAKEGLGYRGSYDKTLDVLLGLCDASFELGARNVAVYFSSVYNLKRQADERAAFFAPEMLFLRDRAESWANERGVSVVVAGYQLPLGRKNHKICRKVEKRTKGQERTLYICLNYSSREEIARAFARFQKHLEEAGGKAGGDARGWFDFLDVPVEFDVLVRSGEDQVLSDFLLPQLANARLFFAGKLFNDMTAEDIKKIFEQYASYELKHGE